MINMFEFKKWGNGSSCYEVILKHDYNTITKQFRYKSLGIVKKDGAVWTVIGNESITGTTRNEVAEKLVK